MSWTRRLARSCATHSRRVLAIWGAVFVVSIGLVGALLGSALTTDARVTTDMEAMVGFELVEDRLPGEEVRGETVVVRSSEHRVGDEAYDAFLTDLTRKITATGVTEATSSVLDTPLAPVSADRAATLLTVRMPDRETAPDDIPAVIDVVEAADADAAFEVDIVGSATMGRDWLELSDKDLKEGELYFGLPAALIVLLLVFGTVVAGAIPWLLAFVTIPISLAITSLIGQVTPLSFFVVNMVTAMGLALGIDYALFIVSRYREERRGGADKVTAIANAGGTAGTAVVFSGMSFTVALVGLLLVPDTILRSLAAGAILVGLVAIAAAVTLLPAVLATLGDRVDRLRIPLVHSAATAGAEGRFWHTIVHAIMRRPVVSLGLSAGVLILAAVPVLGLQIGQSGVSTLPDGLTSKSGFLALERSFPGATESDPARVVVEGDVESAAARSAIRDLQQAVEADGGFGPPRVDVRPEQSLALIDVALPGDPAEEPAKDALERLRPLVDDAFAGAGVSTYITGGTAFTVDYSDLIADWLPIVLLFVLGLTFVLLTVVFRSIVLPLKAVLLNLLSVGASYGLLVLVFQHGVGAELLGLTEVSTVEAWVPVFLFSVLFALSMDYHVFLLSRIREHYSREGDTVAAVAHGIGSTGRIITGAALIIVVVYAGFAMGDLVMFQQMGFGVGVALLLDATVVRSVVVPSSMALLGRWNWYLPRWLDRLPELQVEGAPSEVVLPDAHVPGQRSAHEERALRR